MENNIFQNVNMQEAIKTARELGVPTEQTVPTTPTLTQEQLLQLQKLEAEARQITAQAPVQEPVIEPTLPEGHISGIVVNTQEVLEDAEPTKVQMPHALNDDTMSNIEAYLSEYDEHIEEVKDMVGVTEETTETPDEDEEDEEEKDQQESFLSEYEEAIVVIDKTGMGVVNFTDEEREKLERVKKIKVEEVETLELSTIRTKKPKKKNLNKILQKTKNTLKTTNIVLPASGYTAVIRGCSAYELLELYRDGKNPLVDNETKWSLIYSKIESTSIGKFKDFNDFLEHTSTLDYNVFVYGILCATYPDDDNIPLTCQKCNKEFDHHYTIKSLIRAEAMDPEFQELVTSTIDASHLLPEALAHHDNSPLNTLSRYRLPQSEIIVDLHIQSVHDFIYQSVKKLSDKKDSKYAQASVLSTVVRAFYIEDEDGEYYEITEPEEVTEVIYNLNDVDIKVLNVKMQDLLANKQFDFGLMDMTCPHCSNYVDTLPMNVEQILFFKYQKALNTEVE